MWNPLARKRKIERERGDSGHSALDSIELISLRSDPIPYWHLDSSPKGVCMCVCRIKERYIPLREKKPQINKTTAPRRRHVSHRYVQRRYMTHRYNSEKLYACFAIPTGNKNSRRRWGVDRSKETCRTKRYHTHKKVLVWRLCYTDRLLEVLTRIRTS